MIKKPQSELLLPVGDLDMCLAAIHNGADAVYIGMPGFNARGRTKDHGLDELKEMIDLCHLYGVHVHLAFNILIFENELERALDLLKEVLPMGVDALIVQDLGLALMIRSFAPNQVIHASTQMTITNELAMKVLGDLELSRFVLGREVSIPEMKKIRAQTDKELEVFVHGALCVAYSGQCFTSEAIGGRSANRGQCAQSCRLDYELIVDGKTLTSLDRNYVVSPKDLYGHDHLEELQAIGINSFKVEGRLKGPQYVASVGRLYKSKMLGDENFSLGINKADLERTFSRGFFSGWLEGVDHQQLVDGSYSAHRGEYIGRVVKVGTHRIEVETQVKVDPGMGLLFASATSKSEDKGGFVYDVRPASTGVLSVGMGQAFSTDKIAVGEPVYLNKDPKLDKKLLQTFKSREWLKRIAIDLQIELEVDQVIKVKATTIDDEQVEVESEYVAARALNQALTRDQVQDVFSALTGSAFILRQCEVVMTNELFVPQKVLKELKRLMLEKLIGVRTKRNVTLNDNFRLQDLRKEQEVHSTIPQLNLLVRSHQQLSELLSSARTRGIDLRHYLGHVILDYEFGKEFRESQQLLAQHELKCVIATTRILKPGEYHNLNVIKRLNPAAVLVRNLGALEFFQTEAPHIECLGDFSLNVANSLTFNYLSAKGLATLALGIDLNQWQTLDLLAHVDAGQAEIFIHHHMPEFHMEHCVFAAFLSEGSSFKDCGKPCEKHRVALKDAYGEYHYLAADQECRNTMFKKTPISTLSLIKEWKQKGAGHFRYEALWESGDQVLERVLIYSDVLSDRKDSSAAIKELLKLDDVGITLGQIDRKDSYSDRKQH